MAPPVGQVEGFEILSARTQRRRAAEEKADRRLAKDPRWAEKYYTLATWPAKILATLRERANRKGIPFDITASDLVVPKFCPILGLELQVNRGVAGPNSPSVDQIKASLGYVRGNVRVISNRANRLKCDATVEELKLILTDLESIHGPR